MIYIMVYIFLKNYFELSLLIISTLSSNDLHCVPTVETVRYVHDLAQSLSNIAHGFNRGERIVT